VTGSAVLLESLFSEISQRATVSPRNTFLSFVCMFDLEVDTRGTVVSSISALPPAAVSINLDLECSVKVGDSRVTRLLEVTGALNEDDDDLFDEED
jgi:hypothetical protein